jgi:hypothetical protein
MSGSAVAALPEENEPGLAIEISGEDRSFSKTGWEHSTHAAKLKQPPEIAK